eukprot:TRINITY_DN34032_c0_g1_i1.p2 TRINITY_DN34032_c0_g1~~TRINITY_DN34032_c0_g1_i1.p2  ORF type:complete len:148 (-),score=19.65 TRINITY_DN34032_c0_g1_i1:187-630(-)
MPHVVRSSKSSFFVTILRLSEVGIFFAFPNMAAEIWFGPHRRLPIRDVWPHEVCFNASDVPELEVAFMHPNPSTNFPTRPILQCSLGEAIIWSDRHVSLFMETIFINASSYFGSLTESSVNIFDIYSRTCRKLALIHNSGQNFLTAL